MRKKIFKAVVSAVLTAVMLFAAIPFAADAANSAPADIDFEYGAVLVGMRRNAPNVRELLTDFEIEKVNGLDSEERPDNWRNTYRVVYFKEKSREIVFRAIEALKNNPYINSVEPFYFTYMDYAPGELLVIAKSAAAISLGLRNFEIENCRMIHSAKIYHVVLAEKTKEVVKLAVEALNGRSGIEAAEPNYYRHTCEVIEIKGDANFDKKLDINDVTDIQKYAAKIYDENDICVELANISGNDRVSIIDATLIQKKIAGFAG